MVTATRSSGRCRPAELIVVCDVQTLQHGQHDTSICETYDGQPLPPETLRRLACEASIIPIVMDGPSIVVDVGRARRLAHATVTSPDVPTIVGGDEFRASTDP